MSQNDFIIANQTAPNFRSDLNNALQALASLSSGTTAPSTTYANMLWYDTSNNILKMRSEADDAWINVGYLDQSTNTFKVLDDTQVVNTSGTQTGLLGDQTTATWETGTGTTESLVSPAKVSAAIEAAPTVNFTSSSGSADLPGGLQLRWGQVTSSTDATQTFSYVTPFSNATLRVVVTPEALSGDASIGIPYSIGTKTASGFNLNRDSDLNGSLGVAYIAIGY